MLLLQLLQKLLRPRQQLLGWHGRILLVPPHLQLDVQCGEVCMLTQSCLLRQGRSAQLCSDISGSHITTDAASASSPTAACAAWSGQPSSAATYLTATAPQMLPACPHLQAVAQAGQISQALQLHVILSQHPGGCVCMPPAAACAACQGQPRFTVFRSHSSAWADSSGSPAAPPATWFGSLALLLHPRCCL